MHDTWMLTAIFLYMVCLIVSHRSACLHIQSIKTWFVETGMAQPDRMIPAMRQTMPGEGEVVGDE